MKTSSALSAILVSALAGCAAVPQQRDPSTPPVSPDGIPYATLLPQSEPTGPIPAGFIGFCFRNYDQCDLPHDAPTIVNLTPAAWAQLQQVNASINKGVTYEDDEAHYGISDYWTIAKDGYGDCEDFALTKRKALIDAGISPAALRIAIVLTDKKERHAVLTVTTDRGDFVLDSMSDEVRRWTDTDYVWLERQDPKELWAWDTLNADTSSAQGTATARPPKDTP